MNKEEEKKQEATATQGQDPIPSSKPTNRWRSLLGSRNKELNLDDDDAVGGYLEGEFGRLDKSDEVNKRMSDLIASDKRNAGLLSGVFSGKGEDGEDFSLVDYIVTNWYDELRDAVSQEDAIERINKKMAENEKEAAEEAEKTKDAGAKFEVMAQALRDAMQETNADKATAKQVLDWLYGTEDTPGLYVRIPERSVNKDDFIKLIHAFTRDKSLEEARNEGVRQGKERRAGASHRSSSEMAQTDLGAGTGGASERNEENPTAARYSGMRPRYT